MGALSAVALVAACNEEAVVKERLADCEGGTQQGSYSTQVRSLSDIHLIAPSNLFEGIDVAKGPYGLGVFPTPGKEFKLGIKAVEPNKKGDIEAWNVDVIASCEKMK